MLLGVDVGGTFTDAVLLNGGAVHTAKVPTTPREEQTGVMRAVEAVLARAGAASSDVDVFAHGMTVGTNALLEERGARTALVATRGFADVLEIGRQDRPHLYRLCAPKPAPLVPAGRSGRVWGGGSRAWRRRSGWGRRGWSSRSARTSRRSWRRQSRRAAPR